MQLSCQMKFKQYKGTPKHKIGPHNSRSRDYSNVRGPPLMSFLLVTQKPYKIRLFSGFVARFFCMMQTPAQMFFPVNLESTWHAGQDRVAAVASWGSLGGCCKLFAMRQLLRFSWKTVDPRNTVDGSELRRSPLEIRSLSHYLEGFIHPRWCRISSINSSADTSEILPWLRLAASRTICHGWFFL